MSSKPIAKMYGNPATKQFKHLRIRILREGDVTVKIHKELVEMLRGIILKAQHEGWELPAEIPGWVPYDPEQEMPRHYGIVFTAPSEQVAEYAESVGWTRLPGEVRLEMGWTRGVDAIAEFVDGMEEDRMEKRVQLTPPGDWETRVPGHRELQLGDKGFDVMFFQFASGCPSETGVFDQLTASYAEMYNRRARVVDGGQRVTYGTLSLMTRQRDSSLEHGDTGFQVRVLQSALKAYGWGDDIHINGRFDKPTTAAVQDLQESNKLRASGKVRGPEWIALFKPIML